MFLQYFIGPWELLNTWQDSFNPGYTGGGGGGGEGGYQSTLGVIM